MWAGLLAESRFPWMEAPLGTPRPPEAIGPTLGLRPVLARQPFSRGLSTTAAILSPRARASQLMSNLVCAPAAHSIVLNPEHSPAATPIRSKLVSSFVPT